MINHHWPPGTFRQAQMLRRGSQSSIDLAKEAQARPWGEPNWMVDFMENPIYKCMITIGVPLKFLRETSSRWVHEICLDDLLKNWADLAGGYLITLHPFFADGQNPVRVGNYWTLWDNNGIILGETVYQLVQDFSHPQYSISNIYIYIYIISKNRHIASCFWWFTLRSWSVIKRG